MALDTGRMAELGANASESIAASPREAPAPSLQSGTDIGQALKAIREHQALTLESVADVTRVRRAYLCAIEDMQLQKLPSRPFTIGYIRAYAQALGVDAQAAVDRFKAEEPVFEEALRAPVGVQHSGDPRLLAIMAGAVVIVVAIVLWNIAQRAMIESAPPSPTAPATATAKALDATRAGPVSLGAPLPAPVESTTPPAYETPGLAEAGEDGVNHSVPGKLGVKADGEAAIDPATLPLTFAPSGKVYGAQAQQPSSVTLQALKSASLIVRGADGAVYFARQLAAGEAYRAPLLAGLSIEVSEPDSVQVFVAGQSRGLLPAAKVALGQFAE